VARNLLSTTIPPYANVFTVHTGEKLFKCAACACSKAFNYYHIADKHRRIHSGEKPFRCDVCGQVFSQS